MTRLRPEHLAVIDALMRDVKATLPGMGLPLEFDDRLVARAEQVLGFRSPDDINGFADQFIDDIQQMLHDEFVDVSWPRCPRHPNHPAWHRDGHWWCTRDNVPVGKLGELTSRTE